MRELKPCPFCGSDNDIVIVNSGETWQVECLYCGIKTINCFDKGKAIEAWNTRPIEDKLCAENDKLRAELTSMFEYFTYFDDESPGPKIVNIKIE